MSGRSIPVGRLLAEGVIIVAGVLIALAADRFMQRIDEQEQEAAYLALLLDEFEQAEVDLLAAAEQAETRQAGAELLLAALDGPPPDSVDARELLLGMSLAHWLFDPEVPRETWDDLITTGRSQLIGSARLRRNIGLFHRRVALQAEFHSEWGTFVLPYRREINAVLHPNTQLAIAQYRLDGAPLDDSVVPPMPSLLRSVRSRPALRASVGEVVTVNWAGAWQYRQLAERARDVADQLRDELGQGR